MTPQALGLVPEDLRDIVAKMGGDPFCAPRFRKPTRIDVFDAEFTKLVEQLELVKVSAGTQTYIYTSPYYNNENMRGVATTFLVTDTNFFVPDTNTGSFYRRVVKPHENNPHLQPKHTLKDNL